MQQYNKNSVNNDLKYMKEKSRRPFESDLFLTVNSQIFEFNCGRGRYSFQTDYRPELTSFHNILHPEVITKQNYVVEAIGREVVKNLVQEIMNK